MLHCEASLFSVAAHTSGEDTQRKIGGEGLEIPIDVSRSLNHN